MKKKMMFMIGIAGSIGVSSVCSCNEPSVTKASVPISGAARVVTVDSANDRVIVDTSAPAVTRNVRTFKPQIEISGLRTNNIIAKKGDILFFTIDPDSDLLKKKKLESFRLFSYHAN